MITGPDVSGHQGAVNMAQVAAAGNSFVVAKATEGVGFVDAQFKANRTKAHAAGLIFGAYHFARAGDPVAEAAYFCGVVGSLQPNEFVVLDWECVYSGDHVAWCRAWLDAVTAKLGVRPLIYMNRSTMNGHNWAPIATSTGLWLALYDGATAQPPVSSWSAAAMKQYSDRGACPGVPGACDVNAFYGTADQLRAYGLQGADMPLTSADIDAVAAAVWGRTLAARNGVGPATAEAFLAYTADFATQSLAAVKDIAGRVGQAQVDAQAVADAILAKLPAAQAQQVAQLVLGGLDGAKLSVTPTA